MFIANITAEVLSRRVKKLLSLRLSVSAVKIDQYWYADEVSDTTKVQ